MPTLAKRLPIAVVLAVIACLAVWQAPRLQDTLLLIGVPRITVIVFLVAVFVLWWIRREQIASLRSGRILPDRRAELEEKARATLVQAAGALFFLGTLYFTWESVANTNKQIRIAERQEVTERFSRAVDQLNACGDENLARRLGGIYALEGVADDSDAYHVPVLELLTTYVREHTPRTDVLLEKPLPADIRAILTVIRRRELPYNAPDIDLPGCCLRGADLHWAQLASSDLSTTDLSGAALYGANLVAADLSGTLLSRADLRSANLRDARGLTQRQLDQAITHETTKVDPRLKVRTRKK